MLHVPFGSRTVFVSPLGLHADPDTCLQILNFLLVALEIIARVLDLQIYQEYRLLPDLLR
jgi:hypothetical protein